MKRLVIVLFLLMASSLSAQVLPSGWTGDYVGIAGPLEVHANLNAFSAPWSMPDPIGTFLIYGDVEFFPTQAVLTTSFIADLHCPVSFDCYAWRPRPLVMTKVFPWNAEYHTYIKLTGVPAMPQYSALSVFLGGDIPFAVWREGTFTEYDGEWVVHPGMQMTEYIVTPSVIPLLPYVPRPDVVGGD